MPRSSRTVIRILATFALAFAAACGTTTGAGSGTSPAVQPPDPRNATYRIEKDLLTLTNGKLEREAAPGSATKIVTTVSDVQTTGDVDGDGRPDTVVILVNQPGGSGTFYYVAVLLNAASGVTATPAVLLGDRITVNSVKLDARTIVVDMLDRAAGQPMTASPSVSVAKRFGVDAGALKPQ